MAFSQQPSGQEDGPHFTGWPLVEASGGVGAQELCPLSSLTDHCCALLSLPQCEEIKTTVQRHTQSPMYSKEDLNRLNQAIQRLTVDVDGTKDQSCEPERAWDLTALQAEEASCSAKDKLAYLEAALQRAKQDIAKQLREYQELMIVKLGLDFEIATYRVRRASDGYGMEFGAGSVGKYTFVPGLGLWPHMPARASSAILDTSAPGGGCVLCSSLGRAEGLSGFQGC
uniref:IF rod domain-containing protein n=1 Tax=Cavia porcellus TaxID=10141 RepID=H0W6J3_CAVPO